MYWKLNFEDIMAHVPERTPSMLCDYLIYVSHRKGDFQLFELLGTSTNPMDRISDWEKKHDIHGIRVLMVILMDNAHKFASLYKNTAHLDEKLTQHKQYIIGGYKAFGAPIASFLSPVPLPVTAPVQVPAFPKKPATKPATAQLIPTTGTVFLLHENDWIEASIVNANADKSFTFRTITGLELVRQLRISYYRKDWIL